MASRRGLVGAVGLTVLLFLGIQLGALMLVDPFVDAGRQATENPQDPTNSGVFFLVILLATAVMLAAFRYDVDVLIRALIVGVTGVLSWMVFVELLPPVVTPGGVHGPALVAAVSIAGLLVVYPEWYVIDTAGVLVGAGAAGLFGISFGLLPALVFLVVLAVYDAISVYRTEHMLDLAEGVMDLNIPVVLIAPTTRGFSVRTANAPLPDENTDEGGVADRDALYIGLGDAVIPTILVASAARFLDAGAIDVPLITLTVPALGALLGTLVGLVTLMVLVARGRPHAGLPLLNGGAIGGYLLGATLSSVSLLTALGL